MATIQANVAPEEHQATLSTTVDDKVSSRRPKDTKFKQQKLPAWQPILTATTVLPLLFAIGVAFIPLGIAFLITANNVQEKIIDYTHCVNAENVTCDEYLKNRTGGVCICHVHFSLNEDFKSDVLLYYSLTNFYQNHRRYVKSRDNDQLHGSTNAPIADCSPFVRNGSDGVPYAPCGAVANSMFNDTIAISFESNSGPKEIGLVKKNLAWATDVDSKYHNPPPQTQLNSIPPPNWQKSVWEMGGYKNEDLMVWMRTAALPSFRKLYRRVNHTDVFSGSLPKGNYTLRVDYAFPVTTFGGTKRAILSTVSWLGGKNPFLGIAYIVVGAICIVVGFVFLLIHIRIGKRSRKGRAVELTAMTPYYDPMLPTNRNNSH